MLKGIFTFMAITFICFTGIEFIFTLGSDWKIQWGDICFDTLLVGLAILCWENDRNNFI